MISRFFIDHPIFATVISLLITLTGLVALRNLPIEQYPNITPPQIQVTATYPGADAQTVSDTMSAPLEQQINGVEDMIYMYSQNSGNGNMVINVFFKIGSNADMAQINVQNRVNQALPLLPEQVQRTGIYVQKQTPTFLLIIALHAINDRYDQIFTSNYATINVMDEILRLPGVSNAEVIGARDYSMRLWLRPDKMAQLGLTTEDIIHAVQEQNTEVAIGRIGQAPNLQPVALQLPVTTTGRLSTPQEFDNIIMRANPDGSMVLLKDIGHADLGAQSYDVNGTLDNKPTTLIAVYLQFGANALEVAESVKETVARLEKNFPAGLVTSIPYDTTLFVKMSITEVIITIFEASFLVVIVVLVFLQSLRATLVPITALVVSIIGTFGGMYLLGFSINTLTLFGLILAIGIVVDDAIVVIENVERNMRTFGYSAKEAAQRAMDEVTGPVIAIVFVLCAVFIPVAFLGGIAGQLYKQFAITISISVILSGIVALTFSPVAAVYLLDKKRKPSTFANWFNRHFDALTQHYVKGAQFLIHSSAMGISLFVGILLLLVYFFQTTPTSFVPLEDQGYVIAVASLPDGASLSRTQAVDDKVEQIALQHPGIKHTVSLTGFSALEGLNRTPMGTTFITLTDWEQRKTPELSANGIIAGLYDQYAQIQEAQIPVFNPPAIQGIGTFGGFEFWIQSRGGATMEQLAQTTQNFIAEASKHPSLENLSSSIQANNMQLFIDLDRLKAQSLGVSIGAVFRTLQVLLGSLYINNFNKFGRIFQVVAQAEPAYRADIGDIGEVYVRSNTGKMVPMLSLVNVRFEPGPSLISRFNGFVGAQIIGNASPGYSSGQAMAAMEQLADEILPDDMSYSWSGESYQEKSTGGTSSAMLLGGVIIVFLILAALYEHWLLPVAIILAVPFGIFGAFLAIWVSGMSNDVYFQIGLVTLIALSAKNAILIVEFAILKHKEGLSIIEAALEAARLRFRAILMTSLTFICGVIPLVLSNGAGAASRHSVGTGVLGGMIGATVLALFFVPLFFKLIAQWASKSQNGPKA